MKRVALAEHIELTKGIGLDKNLSGLLRDVYIMMQSHQLNHNETVNKPIFSMNTEALQIIRNLSEEERLNVLAIVRGKLKNRQKSISAF